jgi:ubiquinone/menaquinone biosynthesis C-methylase UbiE
MKIDNKDFWEKEDVIATQRLQFASGFEIFMFQVAKDRMENFGTILKIKIFGCGSGRDVKAVADFYNPKEILASDISENMIEKCKVTIQNWDLESIAFTSVSNATELHKPSNNFQLVTILNSMLTYVPLKKDREAIFKNSYTLLQENGVLIGTVHNQVGTFAKTAYFKLRSVFSFLLKEKVGNRTTGFNGFKVPGYYYSKRQLELDLKNVGFQDISIQSLEEFEVSQGRTYNRKKGYNNLIFVASKTI